MRTDLISAWLAREWLKTGSPELCASWGLEVSHEVKAYAERLKRISPHAPTLFAGQAAIAALAIQWWGLRDVALIAAGTPTPLHPPPDQVLYYTDKNPVALEAARWAGYNTLEVDASSPTDLQQLCKAQTIIATSLLHYLSDFEVQHFFLQVAEIGVKNLVFSQLDVQDDYQVMQQWYDLGINLYPRSIEDIALLITEHWLLERVETLSNVVAWEPTIGAKFQHEQHLLNVFWLTRV